MNEFHQDQESPNNTQNSSYDGSSPMSAGSPYPQRQDDGWGAPSSNYGVPVGRPYVPGEQPDTAHHETAGSTQPQQQYSAANGWQAAPGAVKPKRRKRGLQIFFGCVACVMAVITVGFAGYGIYSLNTVMKHNPQNQSQSSPSVVGGISAGTPAAPTAPQQGIDLQDVPRAAASVSADGQMATEEIVEKVAPSVVAILIYIDGYGGGPKGMGSGIIIRDDGYIVTNAHVVESATGLVVQRDNGDSLEARVIGIDSQTDLAVIKVDATGLPAAVFGNSEQVKVGEKVIAIGNPRSMDFYGSVTQGIVSGLNRQIQATDGRKITSYSDLIQTDAAINEGNSGGALVNAYGQVIGINVAKSGAVGVEGMGFAIPANDAKAVVDDLINVGHVTGRVLLGITTRGAVNQVEVQQGNLPNGVWVSSTTEGSDISKKGVLPGDIITKVDGKDVASVADIQSALKGKKPGDIVTVDVYRAPMSNGSRKNGSFQVSVELLEDTGQTAQPSQQDQQQQPNYGNGYGNGNGSQEEYPNFDPFEYFFGNGYR